MVIRLQRQGVSHSLRAWFNPCPHGERWHIEICDYQGKFFVVNLSYPNCHEFGCFGNNKPKPEAPDDAELTNESWAAYQNALLEWNNGILSGQIAWSSWGKAKPVNIGAAITLAVPEIDRLTGKRCTFASEVEAYCCYTPSDLARDEYLRSDVYVACASYEPATDTIRHEPTNICLVAFDDGGKLRLDIDGAAKKYFEQVDRAMGEYLKAHVQREPEAQRKAWFAWLLSEYIKDDVTGEKPVLLKSMTR